MRLPFLKKKDQRARTSGSDTVDLVAPGPADIRAARKRTRKRRGWVRLLVLAILVLAAGGGVYAWQMQASAKTEQPTIALPVTEGDLSVNVESNGNVQATSQTEVKYETQGQVREVLVKQGDHVEAGQPLVRLSDHDQKLALDEAQAALDTAQAKLDDLKRGSSEADLASAQADVQAAEAALQGVQAGASAKEIADAEADLRAAQANLETVKAGATPKEIADAEAQLRSARANLDTVKAGASPKQIKDAEAELKSAQAELTELKKAPSASEITAAESEFKSAQAKLAELKKGPSDAKLSEKQSAVTQADTALQKIRNDAGLAKDKAELALAKADRDLQQAQRDYGHVADELLNEHGELTVDASDPRYNQYWQAFNGLKDAEAAQSQALAELDNVRQNEIADVQDAQAKLDDANKQLTDIQAGATTSELADAQAVVDKAQKALDDLKAGPAADEVATAEASVTKAQTTLDELKAGAGQDEIADAEAKVVEAQSKVDELKAGPAKTELADAQSTVDKAQNKLKDLNAGPTQADIAEARAKVAQEKAALQKVLEPAAASEIAAANETVVRAQKSVEEARADLDKTILRAPYSGVVSSVDAEANSTITVGDKAVALYNPEGMHLDLDVSEGDIEQVKVGQEASITVDAIPNQTITGTVTSVSPVATSGSDVVNYKVQISFNPGDLPIKVGMSASASIIVQTKKGVMQVPNRAITNEGPFKTVKVMYTKDGKETPVSVHVVTGITNGTMTEITACVDTQNQCLRAGDRVAMNIPTASSGQNGPAGSFTFDPGPGVGISKGGDQPFTIQVGPGPGK